MRRRSITVVLPRRLSAILPAALAARGCCNAMAAELGVPIGVLRQRLSALRGHGLARNVTLIDAAKLGRVRTLNYVRLRSLATLERTAFEDVCRADPAVLEAVFLTGADDYALTAEHNSHGEARLWAQALRCRPEVSKVDQRGLTLRFGGPGGGVPVYYSGATT